jgi:amidophosphoribosyltransferase
VEEIARILGVDTLGYLRLEDLPELTEDYSSGFCSACFTGQYPLDVSGADNKSWLEQPIK